MEASSPSPAGPYPPMAAKRRLQRQMQPVELDVGGDLDAPQNLGLHVVKRDFEMENSGRAHRV